MSPEQMRAALKNAYPGGAWLARLNKMSDRQVAETYLRILNNTPKQLNRSTP